MPSLKVHDVIAGMLVKENLNSPATRVLVSDNTECDYAEATYDIGSGIGYNVFNRKARGVIFQSFNAPTEQAMSSIGAAITEHLLSETVRKNCGIEKINAGVMGIRGRGKSTLLKGTIKQDDWALAHFFDSAQSGKGMYQGQADELGLVSLLDKRYQPLDKDTGIDQEILNTSDIVIFEHPEMPNADISLNDELDILIVTEKFKGSTERCVTIALHEDSPLVDQLKLMKDKLFVSDKILAPNDEKPTND